MLEINFEDHVFDVFDKEKTKKKNKALKEIQDKIADSYLMSGEVKSESLNVKWVAFENPMNQGITIKSVFFINGKEFRFETNVNHINILEEEIEGIVFAKLVDFIAVSVINTDMFHSETHKAIERVKWKVK